MYMYAPEITMRAAGMFALPSPSPSSLLAALVLRAVVALVVTVRAVSVLLTALYVACAAR